MRTTRLIIHQTKHPDHKNSDFEFTAAEELIHSGKAHLTEAERTLAEDALVEGNDFYGLSVAMEYVASYVPVQMGLGIASVIPVLSVQRAARAARRAARGAVRAVRAARRAGAKNIEVQSCG